MIKKFQKIVNKGSKNILTDEEIKRLIYLGKNIRLNLSCNINGTGFPCRSDRLSAVKLMKKYLIIHSERIDESK
jgi:hypothetical protein